MYILSHIIFIFICDTLQSIADYPGGYRIILVIDNLIITRASSLDVAISTEPPSFARRHGYSKHTISRSATHYNQTQSAIEMPRLGD